MTVRLPTILVVDESNDLGRQVGQAIASLRPRPELIRCSRLSDIDDVLVEHPAVDVLIAGPSLTTVDGLHGLRRLRVRLPDSSLILVFDRQRTVGIRDTIRTGAVDILRLPVRDELIAEAIMQALDVRWASVPEVADGPTGGRVGEVIAVVSATGGCGKTFLATNIAYHLHSSTQQRTCVIDLDLQFGELSTALRLKPPSTITDLLASYEDGDDLSARLTDHIVVHKTGIPVLAAPERPAEADGIDSADVARVIEAARRRYDYVILDTPASLTAAVLVALEYADRVFALATLDLPSVRNLGILLATMNDLKVPPDRVGLMLNKVEQDVGMDVAQLTHYFPQGFEIVVPYGREVNRSLNLGMPILAFSPDSEVSKSLNTALLKVWPVGGATPPETSAGGRRWRGRLGRRPA